MAPSSSRDTATRSAETLRPVGSLLAEQGRDVSTWLRGAGLTAADLEEGEKRVPVATVASLFEAALDLSGDPALGLRVVERIGPGMADLFTYLAATSATGREAFERATRYVAVAGSDLDFTLENDGDKTVCRVESAIDSGRVGRFFAEFQVGMMVKFGRMVAGGLTDHNECWFVHSPPEYAEQYEQVYELPVRFDQRCNALIGLARNLDKPLPRADSTLNDLLDHHAREVFERLPRSETFADSVRDAIVRELQSGDPSAEHVAEILGMSARTLRRRLSDEETSHKELLDDVRRELACSYLEGGELNVTQVAFLLGFSDASAFHKAFRRWTGESPRDWLRTRG